MPAHLTPLFFILPAISFLILGLAEIIYSAKRLHSLTRHDSEHAPREAAWSLGNELSMAFILGNACLFFAFHCLRGFWVLASAMAVITVVTAFGSQYRYRQILAPLDLSPDIRKQLLSIHAILATGLFFTIGPQLALILIVLRYTGRL